MNAWFVRPSLLPFERVDSLRRVIEHVRAAGHLHLAQPLGLAFWHDVLIAWPRVRHTMAGLLAMRAVAVELDLLCRRRLWLPRRQLAIPVRASLSPSSVCMHRLTVAAVGALAFYLASTL